MDMASRLNTFQIKGRRGGSEDAAEKPKRRRAVATRGRPVASKAQACSDSNRRAQGIPYLVFKSLSVLNSVRNTGPRFPLHWGKAVANLDQRLCQEGGLSQPCKLMYNVK